MKKLFLGLAAIAMTVGAYAQSDVTPGKTNPQDVNRSQKQTYQNDPIDKTHPDGVVMQDGKLMKVTNGQLVALDQDLTLSNGTKIMRDGTLVKEDGTRTLLEEGQHLDMMGNLTPAEEHKDRNMYLVPDSTKNKDY
jgi:hypothetical protein